MGLTCVQAKIYIALNQIGEETTIDAIAKTAQIARQHVYEPLRTLEKMSLVQRVLDVPPKFEVLPVKETLGILMEFRKKENCELQKKIDFVIRNLQKNQTTKVSPEKEHTSLLIGVEAFSHKADKAVMNARTCFDGIATVDGFRYGMFFSGIYHRNALKRGVHYRHVVSKPEKQFQIGDEDLDKNPLWEVRFSPQPLSFMMTIVDKKEVFISTKAEVTKECSYYWSNNQCFLILAQNYFEIVWKQSSPRKQQTLKCENKPLKKQKREVIKLNAAR